MPQAETPRSWISWLVRLCGSLTPPEWKRLLFRLLLTVVVAFTVSISVLYVAIHSFGFRIKEGKVYLGVYESPLAALVVVYATTGWQNSGLKLQKGEKVRLEPSGRVHLAANQTYNLAQLLKPL